MRDADGSPGFLLDGSGISASQLHPGGNDYMLLPELPVGLKPAAGMMGAAMIDSGVMADHPQLKGLVLDQRDFTGTDPEDRVGHGTVVALILLRSSFKPGSDSIPGIISAKVVQASGRIDRRHVIEAIHWTAGEKRAAVVNVSLGFGGTPEQNAGIRAAIAAHPKTMFVVAAGNQGQDETVYPAGFDLPNILSVGATGKDGAVASYSGRGQIYAPGDVSLYLGRKPTPPPI